jgi:hypothetical protein
VQECLCFTLLIEDFVLTGLGYGDRNFGRIRVENLDEPVPLAGTGIGNDLGLLL